MVKRLNKLFYNIFDGNKCLMIIMCIRKKLFCEVKSKWFNLYDSFFLLDLF